MEKYFILEINGSPKKDGQVGKMLDKALLELTKLGAEIKKVNLCDYKILPHSGKLDQGKYIEDTDDDIPKLQKLVLEADGIIFATPTHWFNVSSLMKLFVDRLTSLEDPNFLLEGKAAGIITYGPQGGAATSAMILAMTVQHWGMALPPHCVVFDEGRRDGWVKRDSALMANNMVQYIKAWKELELNWGYPEEKTKYKTSPIELLENKKKNQN